MNITKLEHWLLERIFKRIVTQGPHAEENITQVNRIMWNATRTEFYEENFPSLSQYLRDCHENALPQYSDKQKENLIERSNRDRRLYPGKSI